MKHSKIILLLLLCLSGIHAKTFAINHHPLVTMKVMAYEGDTIRDSFSIRVKIKFLDTVKQVTPLLAHLPAGWHMMDTSSLETSTVFYPSDSLLLTIHCAYPGRTCQKPSCRNETKI